MNKKRRVVRSVLCPDVWFHILEYCTVADINNLLSTDIFAKHTIPSIEQTVEFLIRETNYKLEYCTELHNVTNQLYDSKYHDELLPLCYKNGKNMYRIFTLSKISTVYRHVFRMQPDATIFTRNFEFIVKYNRPDALEHLLKQIKHHIEHGLLSLRKLRVNTCETTIRFLCNTSSEARSWFIELYKGNDDFYCYMVGILFTSINRGNDLFFSLVDKINTTPGLLTSVYCVVNELGSLYTFSLLKTIMLTVLSNGAKHVIYAFYEKYIQKQTPIIQQEWREVVRSLYLPRFVFEDIKNHYDLAECILWVISMDWTGFLLEQMAPGFLLRTNRQRTISFKFLDEKMNFSVNSHNVKEYRRRLKI